MLVKQDVHILALCMAESYPIKNSFDWPFGSVYRIHGNTFWTQEYFFSWYFELEVDSLYTWKLNHFEFEGRLHISKIKFAAHN